MTEDITIINKLLIFKGDFLTMHNIIREIYSHQEKLHLIKRFQFIKSIAKLFHLQMNILKLFLYTTWDKKCD